VQGGQDFVQWLIDSKAKLANDPQGKILKIDEACAAANMAAEALRKFRAESESWHSPLKSKVVKTAFTDMVKNLEKAVAELQNMKTSIRRIKSDSKKGSSAQRRDYKAQQAKIKTFAVKYGKNLHTNIGEVMSEVLYSLAVDPSTVGLDIERPQLELVAKDDASYDWSKPLFIKPSPAPTDGAAQTHSTYYHKEIADATANIRMGLNGKAKCQHKECAEKKVIQIGAVDNSTRPIVWNEPGKPRCFEMYAKAVKDIVVTQRSLLVDLRPEANPFWGFAGLYRVTHGTAFGFCLTPKQVADHLDTALWLEKAEDSVLAKAPAWYLPNGTSVWVPMGWALVLVGLPSDQDFFAKIPTLAPRGKLAQKSKEAVSPVATEECFTYCVSLCPDTSIAKLLPPELLNALRCRVITSKSCMPTSVRESLEDYFELLDPAA
jgi:hypothetical protein